MSIHVANFYSFRDCWEDLYKWVDLLILPKHPNWQGVPSFRVKNIGIVQRLLDFSWTVEALYPVLKRQQLHLAQGKTPTTLGLKGLSSRSSLYIPLWPLQ